MSELENLESRMLSEAAKATTVEDMTAIGAALKTIAEARTALNSELTGRRAYVLEVIKSLSAFFVPLVSLLALAATIVVQTKQIEAGRQQVENSEWRDLLSSLKGESDSLVVKDVTIAPRLKSFASSPTYGNQAKAVSVNLMNHLSNPDGFQELFLYVFATVNDDNHISVIDLGRRLYKTVKKLEEQCLSIVKEYDEKDTDNILWGCAASISDEKFAKMPIKNEVARKKIESHRQAVIDLNAEAYFLTQQLTPFLRTVYGADTPGNSKPALDFSNLYINNGDFSGLDLSQWDIHNTIFGFVNLTGADLRVSKAEGSEFRSCNWWDAKAINANLLLYGIKTVYPYTYSGQTFPVEVNKEDYTEKVRRLCASAHAACPSELDFGQP